jgi:hypothetical protein
MPKNITILTLKTIWKRFVKRQTSFKELHGNQGQQRHVRPAAGDRIFNKKAVILKNSSLQYFL